MQKVDSAKSARDKRIDSLSAQIDLSCATTVREDSAMAKLDEGKFTVVAVRAEVLFRVC